MADDPKTLIENHYDLKEAITPLVDLVHINDNPRITEAIIELAIVMGIAAAERQLQAVLQRADMQNLPRRFFVTEIDVQP